MKTALLILLCASSSWATFSGYTYRREFVIDASKVSTQTLTLTNFPVLVSTFDITMTTQASGGHLSNASGFDLIFSTTQDCSLSVNFDTETINTVGVSTMNVWVNMPSVSSNTDTPFFMCYGNSGVTTYQGNPAGTWDSNYIGVWHLPNGSSLSAFDSTSNANKGTIFGATATTGQVDGAANFSGSPNYISAPSNLSASPLITVEFWLNKSSFANDDALAMEFTSNGGVNVGGFGIDPNSTTGGGGNFEVFSFGSSSVVNKVFNRPSTGWHHYVVTLKFSDFNNIIQNLYVDGVAQTAVSQINGSNNSNGVNSTLYFMSRNGSALFTTGVMDEVRASGGINRSAGWIQTEYNNQNSPSTFLSVGTETQSPLASNDRGLVIQGGNLQIKGGKVLVQ